MEQTVKVLTSEKNFIKKAFDTQVKKLKDFQDKNYLIPKESKEQLQSDEEPLIAKLQQEIRNLHHRLTQNTQNNEPAESMAAQYDRNYEKSILDALTGKSQIVEVKAPVYFDQA